MNELIIKRPSKILTFFKSFFKYGLVGPKLVAYYYTVSI